MTDRTVPQPGRSITELVESYFGLNTVAAQGGGGPSRVDHLRVADYAQLMRMSRRSMLRAAFHTSCQAETRYIYLALFPSPPPTPLLPHHPNSACTHIYKRKAGSCKCQRPPLLRLQTLRNSTNKLRPLYLRWNAKKSSLPCPPCPSLRTTTTPSPLLRDRRRRTRT